MNFNKNLVGYEAYVLEFKFSIIECKAQKANRNKL